MVHEEVKKFFERLDAIDNKILMRIEKALDEKDKISSELLGDMADISKDMREGKKAEAKTWHYLKEHKSDEEF